MCTAPAFSRSAEVRARSNFASFASTPRKKPSSVARAKRSFLKNGCQTCGSLLRIHIPKNVVSTDARIVVSYEIGTFAGIDHAGLPATFHGQSHAFIHHWRNVPPTRPPKPPRKTITGRMVRLIPI